MLRGDAVHTYISSRSRSIALVPFRRIAGIAAVLITLASTVFAQEPASTTPSTSEEIEPRIVGTTGTTMVGVSGFIDRFGSTAKLYPTTLVVQGDITRFLTTKIAVTGGLAGMGATDADAGTQQSGIGAPALHAFGGALYYLKPQSLASLYFGGSYWNQLTQRDGPDAGSIVGSAGLQASLSSRASLFVEGGYGFSLTKGDEGETLTRILGRVGLRIRL